MAQQHRVYHGTTHHKKKLHHHIIHHTKKVHRSVKWLALIILLPVAVILALTAVNYVPHAAAPPGYVPGTNLLVNGSFETVGADNVPSGWSVSAAGVGKVTRSNSKYFNDGFYDKGHYSMKLEGGGSIAMSYTVDQVVPNLVAGTGYAFEVRCYGPLTTTDPDGQVRTQILFRNGNTVLGTADVAVCGTNTGQWGLQTSVGMKSPAGTNNALIRITTTNLNYRIFVDSFIFRYM